MKLTKLINSIEANKSVEENLTAISKAKALIAQYTKYNKIYCFISSMIAWFNLFLVFLVLLFFIHQDVLIFFNNIPFLAKAIETLGTVSSNGYLEALFIVAFLFVVPPIAGKIIAFPFKFRTVLPEPVESFSNQIEGVKLQYLKSTELDPADIELIGHKHKNPALPMALVCSGLIAVFILVLSFFESFVQVPRYTSSVYLDIALSTVFVFVATLGMLYVIFSVVDFITYYIGCETLMYKPKNIQIANVWKQLEALWIEKDPQKQLSVWSEEQRKKSYYTLSAGIDLSESSGHTLTNADHDELDDLMRISGITIDSSDV